jgi:hypothetical protein
MSDAPADPGLSYARDDTLPQCGCQCHNRELGNVLAELDTDGHFCPQIDAAEPAFWADMPRYVDRRDEAEAVLACAGCRHLHALAFSSDAARIWQGEQRGPVATPPATPAPKLGGPQGRCEPDCRFCKNRDSIREDHT